LEIFLQAPLVRRANSTNSAAIYCHGAKSTLFLSMEFLQAATVMLNGNAVDRRIYRAKDNDVIRTDAFQNLFQRARHSS